MIIYKDIISDDELLSDAYPVKEVDGVLYEVDCAMITIKDGDVDIGANPSAEGGDDDLEEGARTVNNVVHGFNLQETAFDKKSYKQHMMEYMKAVKKHLTETNPDAVDTFMKGAQAQFKRILGSFDDFEFYTGESMNPEAMTVLLNYREDGVTPFLTVWKHGVKEYKI